jgi:hypothetical protein
MATESNFETLLAQSVEELRLKTSAHDAAWHITKADWKVDQATGVVEFAAPDGVKATCQVQIIGTYDKAEGTWLWGWDHPNVLAPLQSHARQVRKYGEEHGIESLTGQKLQCQESAAWGFTALACKLANAQGAYCGPSGSTLVFMTFNDVKGSKNISGS